MGTFSEFTYPAGGQGSYPRSVNRYFRTHGDPSPNKHLLLKKHLDLAVQHYGTHLQGSKVRIFHPHPLADNILLQMNLTGQAGAAVQDVAAEQDLVLGGLSYHLKASPYTYRSGEAYVDFANRKLGGGILREGFVQEEILLLETNVLPWVAAVRGGKAKGTRFCPAVSLKNLDEQPVVLQCRRFLEVAHVDEIYGRRKLAARRPFEAARYLKPLPRPADLYLVAMAAKAFPKGGGYAYSQKDIEAMTLLATRGFYDALMAQVADGKPLVLHTGNWGAGAFGNSRRTMWAIQRVALEAAYALVCQATGKAQAVAFHYDAYDAAGVKDANEAYNVVMTQFPSHRNLGEYIRLIHARTGSDPAWQARSGR